MSQGYQLVALPSGQRTLKKLPLSVRQHLITEAQKLIHNPHLGKQLDGQWTFLRSFRLVYRRTHYRVIYEVSTKRREIAIHYVASRQNFYQSLRSLNPKRSA